MKFTRQEHTIILLVIFISMHQCPINPFPLSPTMNIYMYHTMYHKSALFTVDGSYEN